VPVGTIDAVSTIRMTVRSGARGRCMTPFGTTNPWRGRSSRAHTTATFTQWIGGSDSNRQSHVSPPSRPIQS